MSFSINTKKDFTELLDAEQQQTVLNALRTSTTRYTCVRLTEWYEAETGTYFSLSIHDLQDLCAGMLWDYSLTSNLLSEFTAQEYLDVSSMDRFEGGIRPKWANILNRFAVKCVPVTVKFKDDTITATRTCSRNHDTVFYTRKDGSSYFFEVR